MVRALRRLEYGDNRKIPKKEKYIYRGVGFKLEADPQNELEVIIISKIKEDISLQELLYFKDPNKKFHSEEYLGVHVERGIRYARKLAKKYNGWKRDLSLIVPAFFLHDLRKPDENLKEFDKKDHRVLGSMTPLYMDIDNQDLIKIIAHHDCHYQLFNKYNRFKATERCNAEEIMLNTFIANFEDFSDQLMEAFIRFGYMDRYRPRPKIKTQLEQYKKNKELYEKQMSWFIEFAKLGSLVDKNFESFS